MTATDLFIGGVWGPAASGRRFDVVNPSTGRTIASVADGDVQDALAAVDAAAAAAPGWAATGPRERAEILRRAFELMIARSDALSELISRENGRALPDARGEIGYAAEFFRWHAGEAVRIGGSVSTAPSGANRILVTYQPVGVSVLVTPWNFPVAMATRKIAPALAAGCTMILKPASDTPLTALALAELLTEAGVPAGVVNVVASRSSGRTVAAMLHDPRVRKLSFTGSTEVGRRLLKESADQVINTSMELGGDAPFVVFADADLEAAVDGAMIAKMRNAGEACTAANRFCVEEPVAAEFGRRLAERMAAMVVGPATDPATSVGPPVNQSVVDKVDELVRDAVRRGATALTGAGRLDRDGYFHAPTVLNEEIFGPVAPIMTFAGEDEAVLLANRTEYSLVAYVYTRDLARGLRVGERIEAGMIGLNRGLVSHPAAPFGGVKHRGIGRGGGHEGVLDYLESTYIATTW
ncbi:NAD-dependent succinate-semialdehyde dehydrogenase [Micromonospora sp. NPDC049230]|uniref:NAD-dependent succinate-semialdehyde dehydrogenase n=1 Tax=Micromonospora sp. NPDC049230 TaxID=3155502 RepID=UPI00340A0359